MNSVWNVIRSGVATLDYLTENIGKAISWLNLVLVLIVFFVVILRYLLNIGSIAMQESAMYLHAIIFLGASGYTLKHDGHVRVDVFYRKMSARQKALVNSLGTLFLLIPVCLFVGFMSWEYISNSWRVLETSQDPGGIPYVYLLKSLIMFMVVTLLLQGVAELLRSLMVLFTRHEVHAGVEDHG
ncbi:C4-dicarboxylate ABC transporter permease [Endozoicomonas sp. (ex Bugula neritina AB1)]|nr:C4-dicarboxylate ABC transporter permease [Endozoicomonas sp. (ex Bugula neritina AB1)]